MCSAPSAFSHISVRAWARKPCLLGGLLSLVPAQVGCFYSKSSSVGSFFLVTRLKKLTLICKSPRGCVQVNYCNSCASLVRQAKECNVNKNRMAQLLKIIYSINKWASKVLGEEKKKKKRLSSWIGQVKNLKVTWMYKMCHVHKAQLACNNDHVSCIIYVISVALSLGTAYNHTDALNVHWWDL